MPDLTAVHARLLPNRMVVLEGICLEVVRDLILAGEGPRVRRERLAGQPVVFRGVKRRSESQWHRQLSPTRWLSSAMRTSLPRCLRWKPVAKPAWPAPMISVSTCCVAMGSLLTVGIETRTVDQGAHRERQPSTAQTNG